MFVRKVAARLKPDALGEFTSVMETKILPWLRQQKGFVDLIILAMHGSDEVATISFWNHESDAAAWAANFPEAVEILARLLDGAPYVKTFDVVSSTLHERVPLAEDEPEPFAESHETIN
jgi:heme-degrading monooxygenase HmoA